MTIFDTLRYPISDRPTEEELSALPDDLYSNWLASAGISSHHKPYILSRFYIIYASALGHADIILLRKMISEYNDNI